MTYTIIHKGEVYQRRDFDSFHHYRTGMVVINVLENTYTSDGLNWKTIEIHYETKR